MGRELERCDPGRRSAMLLLAEELIREHRQSSAITVKRARNLKSEIRRRFTRR